MRRRPGTLALLLALAVAASACEGSLDRAGANTSLSSTPQALGDVESWAYQIQGLEEDGATEALVSSPYDMLVIEPTRSIKGSEGFDTAGLVADLHQQGKLVLAYLDIGEAEDYRTYWDDAWQAPGPGTPGDPDFLITTDPDGWSGNYPVAYWDPRWKDIVFHDEGSLIDMALADGFDGVYLDWIEAFSDPYVSAAADAQGLDAAGQMVDFIQEMGDYGRARSPGFLIVAQNAADLGEEVPAYREVIDGLAQEDLSYSGEGDTEWGDPASGDIPTSKDYQGYLLDLFDLYRQAGLPLFCVDYALHDDHVAESYGRHREAGCLGYVSQTPLSRLTETPPPDPSTDTDGDGCADIEEYAGRASPKPGATGPFDAADPYDFFDAPVPAGADPAPNGPMDRVINMGDVLAVLFYFGANDDGPPNGNGVDYDSDKDGNTVEDGLDYDRTASAAPNPPWGAGPPDGTINTEDALAALAQVGLDCTGPP